MRRMTRAIRCGSVQIGGDAPVSIQSMTNTDTRDIEATVRQIRALAEEGCQIVRVAIPDQAAAKALGQIKAAVSLPVVADIHFDYRLALEAIENGADKIRINPGNIGSESRLKAIFDKADAYKIPVRIGVNSGSLEKDLLEKYGGVSAQALCESACKAVAFSESLGFGALVVSLKSADVPMNHQAHRLFAERSDIPLHIGLTEAGVGHQARMKSAVALGALLLEGIGDTMRISLTGDPLQEVILAREILEATGVRRSGIDLVSCPTCGRTRVDLPQIAMQIKEALEPMSKILSGRGEYLRVAVMGCEVNGPGEAASADLGVACGKDCGLILEKGKPVKTVPQAEIADELIRMVHKKMIAK